MRATHSHQETQGSADSVFAVSDGFGAVHGTGGKSSNTPRSMGMRGINGAPDLPLGGSSFHHPLAFSCRRVPTRSLAGTLGHTFLVQRADVVLRRDVLASLQAVLHERHVAQNTRLFVAQQPTRKRPRRHGLRAWPEGRPRDRAPSGWRATSSPQAARMVALVRPPSPPPSAYLSILCRKVATLKSHSSPSTTVNRAPAAGCEVTKSFMSSCMRKYPWVPWGEAREALCANKPRLTVDDERSSHNRRERHFRNPVELESLVHLEPLPARKCDHLRQDGVQKTGGHRVPAHHLLVNAEPFVGAGGLLACDDDLRNRWARSDRKKPRTTTVFMCEAVNM